MFVFFVAVFLFASCHSRPRRTQPNVLLITVDTLRADHLGCYGYRLGTTPAIDRLAEQGVRFADVTVQWPKTWPSMASLLTGTYPATNGIRFAPRRPLPEQNATLAELLKAVGYVTGAVVANVNLGRKFRFDQGFDHFTESWVDEVLRKTGSPTFTNSPGRVKRFTNATIVTNQAISMLDLFAADRGKPFFLWLHYMDPHGPYIPPAEYANLFAGAYPPEPLSAKLLPPYQRQVDSREGGVSGNLGFYRAQYDREIRYVDDQLARLLAALGARGLREHTLIVLTADHGESLGENRYYLEHGALPYQSTAAVPLIMALNGRLPEEMVVRAPVGLIDLLPTVLDLLGEPTLPTLQGRTLLPTLEERPGDGPRHVFMEAGYTDPSQLVVRRGFWKLIHMRSPRDRARSGGREFSLYDLRDDPHEERDVAGEHPKLAEEMRTALTDWLRSTPRREDTAGSIDIEKLDAKTREMMRALGYLK